MAAGKRIFFLLFSINILPKISILEQDRELREKKMSKTHRESFKGSWGGEFSELGKNIK